MNGLGQDFTDPNAAAGTEVYGTSDTTPVSVSPFQDFASGFSSIIGSLTQAAQAFNQPQQPTYTVTASQASKYVPLLILGAGALFLLARR